MTDLEEIINEIETAAARDAGEIIARAEAEAEGIINAAMIDAEKAAVETEAEAERRTAEIMSSGDSARQRRRRERILETKQEIIGEVINKVREKLYSLPAPEYFELLLKLTLSEATAGEGSILLNATDKKRLPPDFEAKLSGVLPAGARLTISDETRPIDGGLILKYGGVEQNCSFESIFNARRDEFSDLIQNALFSGQE